MKKTKTIKGYLSFLKIQKSVPVMFFGMILMGIFTLQLWWMATIFFTLAAIVAFDSWRRFMKSENYY